jgi:two-component system response regulator YesN
VSDGRPGPDARGRAPRRETPFAPERARNLERRFVHPPYLLERRLGERLAAGDYESALVGDNLRSLKNSLIASCTIYTRSAIEGGGVDAEIAFTLSDACIKEIERGRDEAELRDYERSMLREFVDMVREHRAERRDILVWRAVKRVQSMIDREVTLRDTAKELGVSEQHLSAQFSKSMGLSFVEYVRKVKIEEAQYYLRSTRLGVMQIGQMFGFSCQAYFCRVFKAVSGMTPTAYHRLHYQG